MPATLYNIAETAAELKKLRRKLDGTRNAPRIEMLIVFRSGQAAEMSAASALLDVPERTLRRWWKHYRDGGIARLLGERHRAVVDELYPPSTASDRSIPGHVVALLNALPDRADSMEWINQFRGALVELFGDIDRITMNIGFAALPGGTDLMVTRHVGDENRRGRSKIITSRMSKNPGRQLLKDIIADGFPAHLYRTPYIYDYYDGDGTFLGSFILWRKVESRPVSRTTLDTFAALEPFFLFMLSDHTARLQAANPQLKSFAEQVTRIAHEHNLTTREHEVLVHYLVGRTYREIAEHLTISLAAVRKRIESIHAKTKTKSTAELVAQFFAPIRERV